MDQETVNIEKIMEEIREEAANLPDEQILSFSENKSMEEKLSFLENVQKKDELLEQLINEVNDLDSGCCIDYSWDMGKGAKGFAGRVFRRMLRFLLFPLVQRQNEINLRISKCMSIAACLLQIENKSERSD